MKLTILGSGTYQPELERHSSAYLIQTGNPPAGGNICFDFGRGAIDQLFKIGVHINEIDAIFISHWHADHINDLVSLLHVTIAPPADYGVKDSWPKRKLPLKIYGPKGTLENIKKIVQMVFYEENQELNNLEIKEIGDGDKININKIAITSYLAKHNGNLIPLCYRLEESGRVFAYSGDSVESEGLGKAVKNADLAIIEAAWPDEVNPKTHLTGTRAGKFAQENGVKKLVITHMAPLYLQKYDPKADAEKEFRGEVVEARDMLEIKI